MQYSSCPTSNKVQYHCPKYQVQFDIQYILNAPCYININGLLTVRKASKNERFVSHKKKIQKGYGRRWFLLLSFFNWENDTRSCIQWMYWNCIRIQLRYLNCQQIVCVCIFRCNFNRLLIGLERHFKNWWETIQ